MIELATYMARFRYLVFFLLLFTIFSAQDVSAQSNAGITLVPTTIEQSADPGAVITDTLKVTNVSTIDKEFFIYKRNIKGVEAGGVPLFATEEAEKTGYEITEWIDLPTEPLKVSAGSTVDLPIVIRVPSNATPGSHFGGVFVSAEPPKLREIGAGVGYEIASIISIRISGDILDSARIRSLSTSKLLYGSKNVEFTAKIENQGNILIRPRGPMTITSMFSLTPDAITVNDTQAGVFPGTTRDFDFTWNGDGVGFGRYEAILALAYDGEDGQKTIDASVVFWIFPAKILLIIVAVFLTIFALGFVLTKYYINQAIMRAAGGRRITPQKYRKQVGISRFAFVFIALMTVCVVFLLIILIFFS